MNNTEYLLTCLTEECAEIQYISSKINRFGLYDWHPETQIINIDQLNLEINDFMGVIELLKESGVKIEIDNERIKKKKEKILQFMEYSRKTGNLI